MKPKKVVIEAVSNSFGDSMPMKRFVNLTDASVLFGEKPLSIAEAKRWWAERGVVIPEKDAWGIWKFLGNKRYIACGYTYDQAWFGPSTFLCSSRPSDGEVFWAVSFGMDGHVYAGTRPQFFVTGEDFDPLDWSVIIYVELPDGSKATFSNIDFEGVEYELVSTDSTLLPWEQGDTVHIDDLDEFFEGAIWEAYA